MMIIDTIWLQSVDDYYKHVALLDRIIKSIANDYPLNSLTQNSFLINLSSLDIDIGNEE